MVAGCPVRMPNWLKIASRMTASAIHNKICFVRSFKFHLQPMSHFDNESTGAFPKADALTAPYLPAGPCCGPPELTPSQTAAPTDRSQDCGFETLSAFWSPHDHSGCEHPG